MKAPTLTYRERVAALGLALRLGPGDLVHVEVRHAPDCDLLHGRGACTCVPSVSANVDGKLWRVTPCGFIFHDASVELN